MTLVEKLFALKTHAIPRSLEDHELILIADVAVAREYPPGTPVAEPETVLNRLLIVVGGSVIDETSGEAMLPLVGVESLVLEKPVGRSLVTDPVEGATCLLISKGHFFTIINECPEILVKYLEHSRRTETGGSTAPPAAPSD